jgi:hypothetical protein
MKLINEQVYSFSFSSPCLTLSSEQSILEHTHLLFTPVTDGQDCSSVQTCIVHRVLRHLTRRQKIMDRYIFFPFSIHKHKKFPSKSWPKNRLRDLVQKAGAFGFLVQKAGTYWFLVQKAGVLWFLIQKAGAFWFLVQKADAYWFLVQKAGVLWFLII